MRADIVDHLDPAVLVVSAPKGNRERTVPLHPETVRALKDHGMPGSGPLFAGPDGKAVPPWWISQHVNGYLHSIGSDATCHKLRHWFATRIYGNTLDLRLTQELLGHSSPTTTAIYAAYHQAGAAAAVSSLSVAPV